MTWTPQLESGGGPLYQSLLRALERDIGNGILQPGNRLPPQRELAFRLSLGVGTVTRAYEEAARLGLISSRVGRGSFIAEGRTGSGPARGILDLSINQVPLERGTGEMQASLRELARRGVADDLFAYAAPVGTDAARMAGAEWMRWSGKVAVADWERTACTVGAQQAMDQALAALAPIGEPILCESLTYWGVKAQAGFRANPIHGVAMDEQGIMPDALERAVRETGAHTLYCTPTLQNPTTRIMGMDRRREIVKLARKLDLWIVEDDVYAHFARDLDVEPLVNLAPERTIHVTSLSKAVLPGLRAGYLLAPDSDLFERISMGLRGTVCTLPGLPNAIATGWIMEGRAQAIATDNRLEMARRTASTLQTLADAISPPPVEATLHLWLPMERPECERVCARAMALGLRLPDPETFRADEGSDYGVRIAIGTPATAPQLDQALSLLGEALKPARPDHRRAIV